MMVGLAEEIIDDTSRKVYIYIYIIFFKFQFLLKPIGGKGGGGGGDGGRTTGLNIADIPGQSVFLKQDSFSTPDMRFFLSSTRMDKNFDYLQNSFEISKQRL